MRPSHVAARENPHIPLTGVYMCLADALDEYGRVLQSGGNHPPSGAVLAQLDTTAENRYPAIALAPTPVLVGLLAGMSGRDLSRYAPGILTSAATRPATGRAALLEAAADHVGAGRGGKRLAVAWLNLLETLSDSPLWSTVHTNHSGPAIAATGTVYPDGLTDGAVARARTTASVDDSTTVFSAGRILDRSGLLDDASRALLQLNAIRLRHCEPGDVAVHLHWCENPPDGVDEARDDLAARLGELILAGDDAGRDIPSYLERVQRAVRQFDTGAWDHVPHPYLWGVPGHGGSDGLLEAVLGPAAELNPWRRNLYCTLAARTGVSLSPQAAARWLAGARPGDWNAAGIVGVGFEYEPLRDAAIAHIERCWEDPSRLGFGVMGAPYSSPVDEWLADYDLPVEFCAWLLAYNRHAAVRWLTNGRNGATPPTPELVETINEMCLRSPVQSVSPLHWSALSTPRWDAADDQVAPPDVAAWLPGSMSVFGHWSSTGGNYDRYRIAFAAMLADAAGNDEGAWQEIDAASVDPLTGPSVARMADMARRRTGRPA